MAISVQDQDPSRTPPHGLRLDQLRGAGLKVTDSEETQGGENNTPTGKNGQPSGSCLPALLEQRLTARQKITFDPLAPSPSYEKLIARKAESSLVEPPLIRELAITTLTNEGKYPDLRVLLAVLYSTGATQSLLKGHLRESRDEKVSTKSLSDLKERLGFNSGHSDYGKRISTPHAPPSYISGRIAKWIFEKTDMQDSKEMLKLLLKVVTYDKATIEQLKRDLSDIAEEELINAIRQDTVTFKSVGLELTTKEVDTWANDSLYAQNPSLRTSKK